MCTVPLVNARVICDLPRAARLQLTLTSRSHHTMSASGPPPSHMATPHVITTLVPPASRLLRIFCSHRCPGSSAPASLSVFASMSPKLGPVSHRPASPHARVLTSLLRIFCSRLHNVGLAGRPRASLCSAVAILTRQCFQRCLELWSSGGPK